MPKSSWAEFYGHVPGRIDIDRGVTAIMLASGGKISMYKAQPGLFLDPMGNEVDDDLALAAGFDVVNLRKEAHIIKQIKEATDIIHRQAAKAEESIRSQAKENPFEEPVVAPGAATEFNSKGDSRGTQHYVMDYIGGGFWNVISRETSEKVVEHAKVKEAISGMFHAEQIYGSDAEAA